MAKSSKRGKRDDVPSFANATPGFLIDEIKSLRDQIKMLKQQEGMHLEALKGKLSKREKYKPITGEVAVKSPNGDMGRNVGQFESVTQLRLDSAKVRDLLTEEQLVEAQNEITFDQLKVSIEWEEKEE